MKLTKIRVFAGALAMLASVSLFSCKKSKTEGAPVTLTLAAAASLKNAFENDLIPSFKEKQPQITIEATYDSSGKLQTQIENGLGADVFMSAALKQMNALVSGGFINKEDVIELVQNRLVIIKQKGAATEVTGFSVITKAKSIAIGDPASVPAGQYAQEALTKAGNYEAVAGTASLGTNVTEVLSLVAAGSAEVGVVYATDAASEPNVEVIAFADETLLSSPVIYPLSVTAKSGHRDEAQAFVDYLSSDEGIAVFEKYGFARN